MSAEQNSSKSKLQESADPDDEGFQYAKKLDPGTPQPGEEIQLNLKKFAVVLGAILVFAVLAAMFKQFVSAG